MAPRRTTPTPPQAPALTIDQMRRRIERLQSCIRDVGAFDPNTVQKRYGIPEVMALEAAIEEALEAAFGQGTSAYKRYSEAAKLDNGPHNLRMQPAWGHSGPVDYDAQEAQEARRYLADGKLQSIALLHQAIHALEDQIADQEPSSTRTSHEAASKHNFSKVFVVHGHNDGARETIARFIEKLGFEPIILHERPNKGRTIITKFREEAAGVGFAVVLMTPDDVGGVAGSSLEKLHARARQNVVFELAFFIGALGQDRVAALVKGEIERPSDFDGVVYISLDNGEWKKELARELEAAGYDVDWNKAMRS